MPYTEVQIWRAGNRKTRHFGVDFEFQTIQRYNITLFIIPKYVEIITGIAVVTSDARNISVSGLEIALFEPQAKKTLAHKDYITIEYIIQYVLKLSPESLAYHN